MNAYRSPHRGRLALALALVLAQAIAVGAGLRALDLPFWAQLILAAAASFAIWPTAFAIARPYRR